jgi:O-antigen/teichoic acid export membrane protein
VSAGTTPGAPALGGKIKRVAAASAAAMFVGEAVSLVQTIVLARLLTPAEVGLFAAGTVLTMFLSDMSESGLRAGLVHRERDVADAAETVFRGTIVTGLVMSLGAFAAAPLVGLAFDDAAVGAIAAVCSGALFLHALTNVPEAMLQRQFSVKRRLVVGPLVSISFAVTAVTLALLGYGVWSLVAGSYVSYVVWLAGLWAITDWRPGRGRATWQMWRELVRYGFPVTVNFVGARTQQAIEAVAVGRGLSTTDLGFYRYATRISRLPVNAIVDIVANALFPAFSRIAEDGQRLRASYLRALGSVTVFAVVVSGLIIAAGESAVVVLLGEPWRAAGAAVVAMAGLGIGKAFVSVSEEAIKGSGRTRMLNWLTGTEFVVGVASLVLIIPFGLLGVGLAISTTALTAGVVGLYLSRSAVGVTGREMVAVIVPPLAAGAVAVAAVFVLEHQVLHSDAHGLLFGFLLLVVDVLAFLAVYAAALAVVARGTVRTVVLPLLRSRAK